MAELVPLSTSLYVLVVLMSPGRTLDPWSVISRSKHQLILVFIQEQPYIYHWSNISSLWSFSFNLFESTVLYLNYPELSNRYTYEWLRGITNAILNQSSSLNQTDWIIIVSSFLFLLDSSGLSLLYNSFRLITW